MPHKGYKPTEVHKQKLSRSLIGRNPPRTSFKKGYVPWNKGKKGVQSAWNKGKKGCFSEETRKKMSLKAKGKTGYWLGKKRDKESSKKMWESRPRWFGNEKIMREQESKSRWRKNNPEKKLLSDRNYLTKLGLCFQLPRTEYFLALQSWTNTIRKRDSHQCQNCHSLAEISHHILHKLKYPALSLNVNNGIALCKSCHNEVHGWKLI